MIKGLIVVLTQGFANRLTMLASSYIYSKYILKLDLYICWPNASDCNIDYYSIFEDQHQDLFKIINYEDITKLKYNIKSKNRLAKRFLIFSSFNQWIIISTMKIR